MNDWTIQVLVMAIGVVMGSGVTALSYRLPRDLSWVRGRSMCTHCGTTLSVVDLIPLFSWARTGGRCRHCGARISPRYPVTELLCGAWALLLYRSIGPGWDYPLLALWGFMLITLMWIDYDFQLLPDALTFPGTLIGLGAALQWPGGAHHALLGVVAGSGVLWLLAWIYLQVKKIDGMGGGDVKLAAMFGVVLGWKLALLTIFLAAFAGSVWGGWLILRKRGDGMTALPFGTLLAPAAMVALLWGDRWVDAYGSVMRQG